jgi:hypothetical protein
MPSVEKLSRATGCWTTPILRHLQKLGYSVIVAYCDSRAGEIGTIYQACNFLYTGLSTGGKEYLIGGKWRTGVGASKFAHQKRTLADYESRARSTKSRYVYLLGDRSQRQLLRSKLRFPVLPYPKRA